MKAFLKYIIPSAALMLGMGMTSCSGDLDIDPIDPNTKFSTNITGDQLLNKCYANFAVAGQSGANGDCDIDGLDGGTTGFVRQLWNSNDLTTDEAVCAWGDPGIEGWNTAMTDGSNKMLEGLFNRLYVGIAYCNQYIEQYGGQDADKTAQARLIRAFDYYVLLDEFGNVPFTTAVSNEAPQQIKRADLYAWLLQELQEIEPDLSDPTPKTKGQAGYGSVDKAADWMLQARLYLNSEVYTGTAQWENARDMAQKIMNSAYKLYTGPAKNGWSAYQQLFMGDNATNGSSIEAIWPVIQDGERTTAWGNTLFLIAGATNNTEIMNPDGVSTGNGTTEKWSGNRATEQLIEKFISDPTKVADTTHAYQMPGIAKDDRAIFEANDRTLVPTDQKTYLNGWAVCKFNNWTTDGSKTSSTQFPNTNFFLMRAAEAYLIYAEADARLNNGTTTTAGTNALNQLRARANASTKAAYSLDDICDEWSREFYWEGLRRTVLVRFGKFAGNANYNWNWKGGTLAGRNIDSHYNIFPIPSTALTANSNLEQNTGYGR